MNPRPPFSCTTLTLTLHSFSLSNFSLSLFSSLFPFSFSSTPHPTLPVPHTLFLYSLSLEYPFGLLSHSNIQDHSSSRDFPRLVPPTGLLTPAHLVQTPVLSCLLHCSYLFLSSRLTLTASTRFIPFPQPRLVFLSPYATTFCSDSHPLLLPHRFSNRLSYRDLLPLCSLFFLLSACSTLGASFSLSLSSPFSSTAPLSLQVASTFRLYVSFSSFFLFFFLFSFILASVDSWVDRCTAFADTARKSGLTFSLYFCVVFRHLLG